MLGTSVKGGHVWLRAKIKARHVHIHTDNWYPSALFVGAD